MQLLSVFVNVNSHPICRSLYVNVELLEECS